MEFENKTEQRTLKEILINNIDIIKRKKRYTLFLIIIIISFIIISLIIININKATSKLDIEHIGLIEINGVISEKEKTNAKYIIKSINKAFTNKNTKAIILKINSPGGTPVQANIINNHIKRLRLLNNKKIFSVIEDIGTSGAYLIAVATEKIYCDPSSIIGSIGVIINSFGFVESINKLGIERRLYKAGKHKGMMDPFIERNENEDLIINEILNQIHEDFMTNVIKSRNNNLIMDNINEISSGRFWTGKDALKLGLIDGFYDIYSLSTEVFNTKIIVNYTKQKTFIESINKKINKLF